MDIFRRILRLEKRKATKADRPFLNVVYVDNYDEIATLSKNVNHEAHQDFMLTLYMPRPIDPHENKKTKTRSTS